MTGKISDERQLLSERFPSIIRPQGEPKLPLKVGIAEDILEVAPDLEPAVVKKALKDYTGGPTYHRACLAEDAVRIDLKGEPVQPVDDTQKEHHRFRLRNLGAERRGGKGSRQRRNERRSAGEDKQLVDANLRIEKIGRD